MSSKISGKDEPIQPWSGRSGESFKAVIASTCRSRLRLTSGLRSSGTPGKLPQPHSDSAPRRASPAGLAAARQLCCVLCVAAAFPGLPRWHRHGWPDGPVAPWLEWQSGFPASLLVVWCLVVPLPAAAASCQRACAPSAFGALGQVFLVIFSRILETLDSACDPCVVVTRATRLFLFLFGSLACPHRPTALPTVAWTRFHIEFTNVRKDGSDTMKHELLVFTSLVHL